MAAAQQIMAQNQFPNSYAAQQQYAEAAASIQKLQAAIQQANQAEVTQGINLQDLAGKFGLTNSESEALAHSLDIDLNKALSPTQRPRVRAGPAIPSHAIPHDKCRHRRRRHSGRSFDPAARCQHQGVGVQLVRHR